MTPLTHIIAIRHGETDWNLENRIQGHSDIPLNEKGYWQAERTANVLAEDVIHAIYSSDLKRAADTARAVGLKQGIEPELTAQLRERHFGFFEGQTFKALETHYPEDSKKWRGRDPQWCPAGGESLLQLEARIIQTACRLASDHRGQTIALVAHGGVMDILYRAANRLELNAPRTWEIPNTAINRLLWTPEGFSLVCWGDTRHLDEPSSDEFTT